MTGNTQRELDPIRQRRLAKHYLSPTPEDAARMQRTVAMAARALDFPIGQINILDDRFQYTIGDHGSGTTILDRDQTLCQVLMTDGGPALAVEDLSADERFRDLPAVRAGIALSYLGVPLASREAARVGTLCVIAGQPRDISDDDVRRLSAFAEIVEDQLDLARRNAETAASREVSTLLAEALVMGEIVPWYQPLFELSTGIHRGFEALARWHRPDGTVVRPESFVAAAEDSDLVVDLDRAVARAALHDVARWRRSNPDLRMGINLSTRHFELSDGASFVIEAMRDAGVDPSGVVVEITETRVLTELTVAAAAVAELQAAGCRVVLDDFANGWSNLDWLLELGADGLKIDRSVTNALGTRVGDAVCRAVVGLATELDMSTTIEGISDDAQLAASVAHGFEYGQGYHWSPPVPAAMVDAAVDV